MPLTPQYPINEESQYQWENSIASESIRILEIAEMSSDAQPNRPPDNRVCNPDLTIHAQHDSTAGPDSNPALANCLNATRISN
jgi:hypothetical protein